MAVKLRLKRMGAKQKAYYRIVASDSRFQRDGRFIEVVGTYNPIKEPAEVTIDEEKALKWLNTGAEPTDTVRSLLSKQGIIKKFTDAKIKSKVKKEVKEPKEKAPISKVAPKKTTPKTPKKSGK